MATTSLRSVKKAVLSLGITGFPVKLYSAARDEGSGLKMAVKNEDGSVVTVTQRYTADAVTHIFPNQVGRAVDVGGKLVFVTKEEIDDCNIKESPDSDVINLTKFVPLADVDPVYFDKSYLVAPNTDTPKKGGDPNSVNLYAVLVHTLLKAQKVGLAKLVMRGKDHNVIVRVNGNGKLMLHTIFVAGEVRDIDIASPTMVITEAHYQMGLTLIESNSVPFDAKSLVCESDARMNALIERKTQEAMYGDAAAATPNESSDAASSTAGSIDLLMAGLQASLIAKGVNPNPNPTPKAEEPEPKAKSTKKQKTAKA